MMDMMIRSISKEKREKMMINMMPLMMEGMDMYEFMPKMMTDMLKDVTVDDVIAFIKQAIEAQDKLKELADKIGDLYANPALRDAIGAQACISARERFNQQTYGTNVENVLQRVVGAGQGPSEWRPGNAASQSGNRAA